MDAKEVLLRLCGAGKTGSLKIYFVHSRCQRKSPSDVGQQSFHPARVCQQVRRRGLTRRWKANELVDQLVQVRANGRRDMGAKGPHS